MKKADKEKAGVHSGPVNITKNWLGQWTVQVSNRPLSWVCQNNFFWQTKPKKEWDGANRDKSIALSLFHASPKAYRLISRFFHLPSISTLQRTMQRIQVYPGFNDDILTALRAAVSSMPPTSALCAVVFDEMSVKEGVSHNIEKDEVKGLENFGCLGRSHYVANHATVFMVRGLVAKWKQPVGYILLSGPISSEILHAILIQCIEHCKAAGLIVKVIIGDQGPNNRKLFEGHLGATEFSPYFEHAGNRIFVMYDPPHLLKNIRNNLRKTGFTVESQDIKWDYIRQFYVFDKQNLLRMAPKLTSTSICPHLLIWRWVMQPKFCLTRWQWACQCWSS